MCDKTVINAQFKKINPAINAIKEINRLTGLVFITTALQLKEKCSTRQHRCAIIREF